MEEYLLHMKTLRAQMNEVEDQAAKISVEEQMHLTTVQNLEKDLLFVKNETKLVKEESDNMMKSKGLICSHILEKQQKIASLELDSCTLSQTLELMQQERALLTAKVNEKSSYYTKVAEDIATQLKNQKVEDKSCYKTCNSEESQADAMDSLMLKLDAAKAEFERMILMKDNLVLENSKIKQSIELVKAKIENFRPELRELDIKILDEELQALLGDKDGEAEYMESLQRQIMTLKEISQTVKCSCGEEYKAEVGCCAET